MVEQLINIKKYLSDLHSKCLIDLNGTLDNTSGTLYHYTSLEAVCSILQHQTLRLTDVRYCNDPEEIEGGLAILEKVYDSVFPEYRKKDPAFAYLLNLIVKLLRNGLSLSSEIYQKRENRMQADIQSLNVSIPSFEIPKISVFVSCFSEKSDDLRQWMPYGDDGKGVAIGFKGLNVHHDISEEDDIWIVKACYKGDDAKEKFVKDIMAGLYEAFVSYGLQEFVHSLELIMESLMFDIIACKSSKYCDEAEWRLIKYGPKEKMANLQNVLNKNYILRPYVDIKFNKEALLEIKLGPKLERGLNSNAFEALLKRCKYENAQVSVSDIKYR